MKSSTRSLLFEAYELLGEPSLMKPITGCCWAYAASAILLRRRPADELAALQYRGSRGVGLRVGILCMNRFDPRPARYRKEQSVNKNRGAGKANFYLSANFRDK